MQRFRVFGFTLNWVRDSQRKHFWFAAWSGWTRLGPECKKRTGLEVDQINGKQKPKTPLTLRQQKEAQVVASGFPSRTRPSHARQSLYFCPWVFIGTTVHIASSLSFSLAHSHGGMDAIRESEALDLASPCGEISHPARLWL